MCVCMYGSSQQENVSFSTQRSKQIDEGAVHRQRKRRVEKHTGRQTQTERPERDESVRDGFSHPLPFTCIERNWRVVPAPFIFERRPKKPTMRWTSRTRCPCYWIVSYLSSRSMYVSFLTIYCYLSVSLLSLLTSTTTQRVSIHPFPSITTPPLSLHCCHRSLPCYRVLSIYLSFSLSLSYTFIHPFMHPPKTERTKYNEPSFQCQSL